MTEEHNKTFQERAAKIAEGWKAPSELAVLLKILDFLLTGKSNDYQHRDPHRSPEDMFGADGMYYLSDGGYSRVAIDDRNSEPFLTSNSRKEVKDRWDLPEVVWVRRKIQETMNQYLRPTC